MLPQFYQQQQIHQVPREQQDLSASSNQRGIRLLQPSADNQAPSMFDNSFIISQPQQQPSQVLPRAGSAHLHRTSNSLPRATPVSFLGYQVPMQPSITASPWTQTNLRIPQQHIQQSSSSNNTANIPQTPQQPQQVQTPVSSPPQPPQQQQQLPQQQQQLPQQFQQQSQQQPPQLAQQLQQIPNSLGGLNPLVQALRYQQSQIPQQFFQPLQQIQQIQPNFQPNYNNSTIKQSLPQQQQQQLPLISLVPQFQQIPTFIQTIPLITGNNTIVQIPPLSQQQPTRLVLSQMRTTPIINKENKLHKSVVLDSNSSPNNKENDEAIIADQLISGRNDDQNSNEEEQSNNKQAYSSQNPSETIRLRVQVQDLLDKLALRDEEIHIYAEYVNQRKGLEGEKKTLEEDLFIAKSKLLLLEGKKQSESLSSLVRQQQSEISDLRLQLQEVQIVNSDLSAELRKIKRAAEGEGFQQNRSFSNSNDHLEKSYVSRSNVDQLNRSFQKEKENQLLQVKIQSLERNLLILEKENRLLKENQSNYASNRI